MRNGLTNKALAVGAYLLKITLARPVLLSGNRLAGLALAPGDYLYAGSARGPGGIQARLKHHFSKAKKPHWHVDQLTLAAQRLESRAFPGGSECELLQHLLRLPGMSVPIPGFGASDCRLCPAHLLKAPDGFSLGDVPPVSRRRPGTGRPAAPANRRSGPGGTI
ncbi:MAG: GIY-YIG nuclease family protein [Rhodospirillales bacterium]|jgi:Uri superfamily endonuclease